MTTIINKRFYRISFIAITFKLCNYYKKILQNPQKNL